MGVALVIAFSQGAGAAQQQVVKGPPMPYEDAGACPFECCVYREWRANASVTLYRDRRIGSGVAFTANRGDELRALTGVVVTLAPGRVQFRAPVDLRTTTGILHVEPGETLYLLTYLGEGSTRAWFQGHVYDEVDGAEFFNSRCAERPGTCNGSIVEAPRSEWWVRVRSPKGITGWTNEPEKFDNKDACGG